MIDKLKQKLTEWLKNTEDEMDFINEDFDRYRENREQYKHLNSRRRTLIQVIEMIDEMVEIDKINGGQDEYKKTESD